MKYLFVLMLTVFALVGCREKNEYIPDPSAVKFNEFKNECDSLGGSLDTRREGGSTSDGIPLPGTKVFQVCYKVDKTDPEFPVRVTLKEYQSYPK